MVIETFERLKIKEFFLRN